MEFATKFSICLKLAEITLYRKIKGSSKFASSVLQYLFQRCRNLKVIFDFDAFLGNSD